MYFSDILKVVYGTGVGDAVKKWALVIAEWQYIYISLNVMHFKTCTDPDVLSFSWFPGPSMFQDVKPVAMRDVKKNGNGVLQVWSLLHSRNVELEKYDKVLAIWIVKLF